jgi:hypothetical protein
MSNRPCGTQASSPPKPCTSEKNQNSSTSCQTARVIRLATSLFKTDKAFRNAWLNYVKVDDLATLKRRANNIHTFQPQGAANLEAQATHKTRIEEYAQANASNTLVTNGVTKYALDQISMRIRSEKILNVINGLGIFKLSKDTSQQWRAFSPKSNNTKGCDWAKSNPEFRENVILLLLEQERVKGGKKTRNHRRMRRSTRRN